MQTFVKVFADPRLLAVIGFLFVVGFVTRLARH